METFFFYKKAQHLILKFLSLCQFVCLCVFIMVRNEIISSQAVRGARSSCRNLHALLAAPVARPRERRQVGYFTLISRFSFKYVCLLKANHQYKLSKQHKT